MHHVGVGRDHIGKPVFALIDETTVTIIRISTGEVTAEATIDPNRNYWRNRLNPRTRKPT